MCGCITASNYTGMLSGRTSDKYKKINVEVHHVKRCSDLPLHFPQLGKSSVKPLVYSDALFATNNDRTSQIGYFIFLKDNSKRFQSLYWTSYISNRSKRSVLGSEVIAFADAF